MTITGIPENTTSISECNYGTGRIKVSRQYTVEAAEERGRVQGPRVLGEEAIWGHRLWYRETPWLLFLEFLNIAEAFHQQGALFVADLSKPLVLHRFHQRIALRNVLFNNSALGRIADSNKTDAVKWEEWIRCMNEESEPNTGIDYTYLKSRFARFQDFAKTVDLLRQTVIEPDSNRRWSSRFVFPFGPAALYEDLSISNGKVERQAINFGRTGDLLYMMLSRSSCAADLAGELETAG